MDCSERAIVISGRLRVRCVFPAALIASSVVTEKVLQAVPKARMILRRTRDLVVVFLLVAIWLTLRRRKCRKQEHLDFIGCSCCWNIHGWTPVRLGRTGRSLQFGRTSAPIIPQLLHTVRGPKDGTGT